MYQVNIIYEKDIMKIIFNCISYEDALETESKEINKWFRKKMDEGIEPAEIYYKLETEIKNQDGEGEAKI